MANERDNPFVIRTSAELASLGASLHARGLDQTLLARLPVVGLPGWKARVRSACDALDTGLGTLVRLWIIGDEVERARLAALLDQSLLAALVGAGVLEERAGTLRALVTLAPAEGLVIASDRIRDDEDAGTDATNVPEDFVLGVGHATRIVDDLSVRVPCDVALDVGCGQGYLTLRAAGHAVRSVGTDISRRALAFARLSHAMNGASAGSTGAVEWRHGSFFEPVDDLRGRCGLFTCNPPFVIASGSAATAIASAFEGDGAMEHVVRGALEMLAPGGWASIVGMWEAADARDWSLRPRAWLANSGVDALLLHFESLTPAAYYPRWTTNAHPEQGAAFEAACTRRGVSAIVFGAMVLRRREGANWMRAQAIHPQARNGSASAQLPILFETQTRLNELPNLHAILDARLRVVPEASYRPASAPGQRGVLFHAKGLALPMPAEADVARCLESFDGARTARAALREASRRGAIAPVVDEAGAARVVHALASGGFLAWAR